MGSEDRKKGKVKPHVYIYIYAYEHLYVEVGHAAPGDCRLGGGRLGGNCFDNNYHRRSF